MANLLELLNNLSQPRAVKTAASSGPQGSEMEALGAAPNTTPAREGSFGAEQAAYEKKNTPLGPDNTPSSINSGPLSGATKAVNFTGPEKSVTGEDTPPYKMDPLADKLAAMSDLELVRNANAVLTELAGLGKKADQGSEALKEDEEETRRRTEQAAKDDGKDGKSLAGVVAADKKIIEDDDKEEKAAAEAAAKVLSGAVDPIKDRNIPEDQKQALENYVVNEAAVLCDTAKQDARNVAEFVSGYQRSKTAHLQKLAEDEQRATLADEGTRHAQVMRDSRAEVDDGRSGDTHPSVQSGAEIPKPLGAKRGPGRPRKEAAEKVASYLLHKQADDGQDAAAAQAAVEPAAMPPGDPSAGAPGAGDPGAGDPGAGDPGAGDPGAGEVPPEVLQVIEQLLQSGYSPEQIIAMAQSEGGDGSGDPAAMAGAGAPPAAAAA